MNIRSLGSLAILLVSSLTFWGCGGSSGGGGGATASPGDFMSATVQGLAPAVSLGVQSSLNVIDPVNFPALQGTSPTVVVTGTPTTGTVTLDFGASTIINNATWSGTVVADFTVTGANTFDLSVDLTNLTFTTTRLGTVSMSPGSGTFVLTGVSWNAGTTSASGFGDPTYIVDVQWGGRSYEVDMWAMHSWTFDPVGTEQQTIVGEFNFVRFVGAGSDDGFCELDSFDPLVMRLNGANREAMIGLAICVRTPGNQENFTFSPSNGGTVFAVPAGQPPTSGTTSPFSL